MSLTKASLLVVDDYISIRQSIVAILAGAGFKVSSAEDGFSALAQIRNEMPHILISDLNMPGMSGFELLSVVRRRFPAIRVIAMSGAFLGCEVPLGVIADAFYEKGAGPHALLQIVESVSRSLETSPSERPLVLTPVWLPSNGHYPSGKGYVMLTCQECLRTFPQVIGQFHGTIHQTRCAFCNSVVEYAIVPPAIPTFVADISAEAAFRPTERAEISPLSN
jgi:CheY-like chemotaxis protein